jgi:restriction endonuclease Mrr
VCDHVAAARGSFGSVRPTKNIVTTSKNKKTASQFARYIGPVLQAIRELGGSGRPDEVRTVIAGNLGISDAEQSEPLPSGVQTRFENQVHWARFYLAKAGYIDSSQRGVWTLTEKGRSLGEITPDEIQRIIREVWAPLLRSMTAVNMPISTTAGFATVCTFSQCGAKVTKRVCATRIAAQSLVEDGVAVRFV